MVSLIFRTSVLRDAHIVPVVNLRLKFREAKQLLQGILPTQGSNQDLSHCRQILYSLSHQGSPRQLLNVTYPADSKARIEPILPATVLY